MNTERLWETCIGSNDNKSFRSNYSYGHWLAVLMHSWSPIYQSKLINLVEGRSRVKTKAKHDILVECRVLHHKKKRACTQVTVKVAIGRRWLDFSSIPRYSQDKQSHLDGYSYVESDYCSPRTSVENAELQTTFIFFHDYKQLSTSSLKNIMRSVSYIVSSGFKIV